MISRVHVFDSANHIDETNGFSFEKNANESHEDIMGHGEVFEPEHHVAGSLSVKRLNGHEEEMDQNDPSLSSTFTSLNLMGSAAASALLENHQEEEPITLIEEDEEDQIYDPSASLVDDYDYDLYQDRKHFLMSDYKRWKTISKLRPDRDIIMFHTKERNSSSIKVNRVMNTMKRCTLPRTC